LRTHDEILAVSTVLEPLLQTVGGSLAFQVVGGGLKRSWGEGQCGRSGCEGGFRTGENSRGGVRVEEDVAVFEFLGIGAGLKVFLEGVLADVVGSDGGDRGRINEGLVGSWSGHV